MDVIGSLLAQRRRSRGELLETGVLCVVLSVIRACSPPGAPEIETEHKAKALRAEVDDLYQRLRGPVLRATGGRMSSEMPDVRGDTCGDGDGWSSRFRALERSGVLLVPADRPDVLTTVRDLWAADGWTIQPADTPTVDFDTEFSPKITVVVTLGRAPEHDRPRYRAYELFVSTKCLGLPESLTSRVTWT